MIDSADLPEVLNSVTTIPLIPFRRGVIDYAAHRKNIEYLMTNNHLSGGRPRVICVAGTSLIHHVDSDDQNRLLKASAEAMGNEGVLISAVSPTPISSAHEIVETQMAMPRPPDAFLIMPLTGVYSLEGLYEGFSQFGEKLLMAEGARFLYYHRQARDRDQVIRLVKDSPAFVGVKVGSSEDDVVPMVEGIGDAGIVMWGIGDRSTAAARLGASGHTSGISVLFAKAGDLINNAQREGDFERAQEVENRIAAFELLRFENGRVYNYSAVVEAMIQSGFDDIDPGDGDGGPFNPRVEPEVAERVKQAIGGILDLH
jgi:dihydrodipicolinate synthase/N-acetylneuraminate lyase